MGMSAHHDLLFNAGEDGVEPLLWRDGCKDLLVAARGGMAEQDISQALNVERDLLRTPSTCYERADFFISWSTLSAASAISYTAVLSPGFLISKMIPHIRP